MRHCRAVENWRMSVRTAIRRAKSPLQEDIILDIIQADSKGDPEAVGKDGLAGLMHIPPIVARAMDLDTDDPEECIQAGVKYLTRLVKFCGSLDKALKFYRSVDPYGESKAGDDV
jgi:membrane-bound lytic murein transglycosylase MltF